MIERERPSIITDSKVIHHEEFLNRIKKTLYYGSSTVKCTKISRPLADYAADIFSESHRGHSLSRLNFVTVGNLTVTPCSLILAMIYLDRLNVIDPAYARRITPSELFIVSMMVSTKFYCGYDEDVYVSAWAESGSMSVDHMKELELEFLDAIDWKVYVSNQEFFEKLKSVERVLARRQGLSRGWLTYTELINFLPTMTLAKQILNYSTVIALSYTASVMTIAGAFFLASSINIPGNLLYRGASSQQSPLSSGETSTGVSKPSQISGQNCTMIPSSEQTLSLEACECSLQMAIESVELLNHVCYNDHSTYERHNYKADFVQLPKFAAPSSVDGRDKAPAWKRFRFIYPMSGGNSDDDDNATEPKLRKSELSPDDIETWNCTFGDLLPALAKNEKSQCIMHDSEDEPTTNRIFTSYKRTFEMFSSFLKFL